MNPWQEWENSILIFLSKDLDLVDILASLLLLEQMTYWICDAYFQWWQQHL